ncbi:MAG TPA: hypothetical protein VNK04_12060 [Gemmataceae bacterium]|nr:hypothetical protein [Gemmataceae bacterium]
MNRFDTATVVNDPALPPSPAAAAGSVGVRGTHAPLEESLVADARSGLTPAQMVERKLASLLRSNPMPVSYLMTRACTRRNH